MPANAIDLCTVSDVRLFLSIVSGLPNNSSQTSEVSTSSTSNIAAGTQIVTPGTMANIFVGSVLGIDTGTNFELVSVTAVSSTTFTATFSKAHTATIPVPIPIADQTDLTIQKLITSASTYWLWATGKDGGNVPTVSPFVTPVAYDEWYNGNGNLTLFLRQSPVVSVALVQVSGLTIPPSTDWNIPGYTVQDGKALAIRSAGGYNGGRGAYGYGQYALSRFGPGYCFIQGNQNVHIQYTAGYTQVPFDVNDAATEMVAVNFQRRRYLDQDQNAAPQATGTTTYSKLEVPKRVASIMDNYSRGYFA